jgi:hypothetical protein
LAIVAVLLYMIVAYGPPPIFSRQRYRKKRTPRPNRPRNAEPVDFEGAGRSGDGD